MWSDLPFECFHPCLVCKSGRILHTERWIGELVDVDCRFSYSSSFALSVKPFNPSNVWRPLATITTFS